MPHFSFEYSANLEDIIDISALCTVIREAAIETDLFPMPGIRVRGFKAVHYSIADGNRKHAFLDLSVRLRAGRPQDKKEAAIQFIFNAMKTFIQPALDQHSIALSMEMRDIDPTLSPKTGTIREHLSAES